MSLVYLGIGSNLGDRRVHIETALTKLALVPGVVVRRLSAIHETPALLPEKAPSSWNRPYWNLVVEIDALIAPRDLLRETQRIEREVGRERVERWAPRTLDIDLVFWEGVELNSPELILPHPGALERAFVLDPLAELAPSLFIAGGSVLEHSKRQKKHLPRLMGIINLTPDSFSDGGVYSSEDRMVSRLEEWDLLPISILDLGAESTRPGATPVDPETEWARLHPYLKALRKRYLGKWIKPRISVDTRHAETARRALDFGADMINDVSHFSDPQMLEVLRGSACEVILMHSLTVPADPKTAIPSDEPPMVQVSRWMEAQLERLERAGIHRHRIILDPGIGFGKTSLQSLELMLALKELQSLGYPVLVGHSRKSFFRDWSSLSSRNLDPETLGVSLNLISKGVDILRVHDPVLHHRAILAWNHINH